MPEPRGRLTLAELEDAIGSDSVGPFANPPRTRLRSLVARRLVPTSRSGGREGGLLGATVFCPDVEVKRKAGGPGPSFSRFEAEAVLQAGQSRARRGGWQLWRPVQARPDGLHHTSAAPALRPPSPHVRNNTMALYANVIAVGRRRRLSSA